MASSLRERLVAFRAAYYRIRIVRGLLLAAVLSGLVFALFSLTEGLFWWTVPVRSLLWGIWVIGTALLLGWGVVYPLLQYGFRLRGYLSDEEAARWIGRRLPEVQDKLLNALQLSQQDPHENAALVLAIEERMQRLAVIPWEVTLPKADIRRYALYLLLVVGGIALLWVVSPSFFRAGALRFLKPRQAFARPLPYQLAIEGLKPFYKKGEPLFLRFVLQGDRLPKDLFASTDRGPLPLTQEAAHRYVLQVGSLQEDFVLRLETPEGLLREVSIRVLQPPAVTKLAIACSYPPYTRLRPDTLFQPTIRVLKGTQLDISLQVAETGRAYQVGGERGVWRALGEGRWVAHMTALESGIYPVVVWDSLFRDSLFLRVEVYPDAYPSVQLFSDWLNPDSWMQGIRLRLMDDYGFSRAVLWYRIVEGLAPGRTQESYRAYPLPIGEEATQERSFTLDWKQMGVQPGEKVEYYVEAWDNDAISGPKSSRSILYTLEPQNDEARQRVFASLQDSVIQELQKLSRELQGLLSQSDLNAVGRKATQLSERFRELRSELRSLARLAEEQQLYTPELLEQMRRLQQLLEEMQPQKPEQLWSELQQIPPTDSVRLEQWQKELEKAFREWQEKLERWEALLPAYRFDRQLEELMTRLSEMAERQARMADLPDSLQRTAATQALQQRLKEETEQLRRQVDSLQTGASGVLRDSMERAKGYLQEAIQSMQEALQKMQSGEGSPQESQKNAAQSLERALNSIDEGHQQAQGAEEAEEYEALRMLLKGILTLSFRQEVLRSKAQENRSLSSVLEAVFSEQGVLRRDYQQVRDSLYALAHRSPVIEEAILDLLRDMDRYFQGLSVQDPVLLIRRQQYILQGLNRLANLLTELLAQLESNQQNRQQAGGACQRSFRIRRKGAQGRPSSSAGQPSPSQAGQRPSGRPKEGNKPSLEQLQRQLNEALERSLSPNPGAENPGGLTPEERARLSAQQELIRLRLQERLRHSPGDAAQLQSLLEEMQKAEKELLGGQITRERLFRQQQILTRLLDYERSQRERELSPERESRTAQQFFQRTVGVYPQPQVSPSSATSAPPVWLYRPFYQQLIEKYLRSYE